MSAQPSSELPLPLNLSSGSTANAPDVQLQVGPTLTNFSAHRNVLSSHSGFFKAALNSCTSSGGGGGVLGPILVPNIAVDEFSSLLTFMYTGYLDLNLANIYNILLATHILHMPRALELCRSFLMQTQQQQHQQLESHTSTASTSTAIIKPIASRKPLPNIEALTAMAIGENPNEKKIFNNSVFKVYSSADAEPDTNDASVKVLDEAPKSEPSTSKSMEKSKVDKVLKKDKKRRISSLVAQAACTLSEERVIVDIACCDGPVRFHRVVNKNYGRKTHPPNAAAADDEITYKKRTTLAAINKIMTENIKLASSTNGESNSEAENLSSVPPPPDASLYTCLYCNHTFKSQYCYQKHARRHLNPVDAVKTPSEGRKDGESTSFATKREFKLLDMNVQYYPCKTCGSKFPSYYFVHKHRKLCHADEMADGTNKNNEIVQVKPKVKKNARAAGEGGEDADGAEDDVPPEAALEDTTGSDIIDVEETN